MSGQLESRHFLRPKDTVESVDGQTGVVIDATALRATVRWTDGREEELEQFDPRLSVVERAPLS